MISADKARMLFKTKDELKEKRINEVVDQVLSVLEQDITFAAREYKSVSVRILFADMRNYEDTHGIDYHTTDKSIYIDSIDSKRIFYNNGIKAEDCFKVIVRVFDKLSELGYKSDLNIDELSVRELPFQGELRFIKISWE